LHDTGREKSKYSSKTCPSATLFTTDSTYIDVGSKLENTLSHGTSQGDMCETCSIYEGDENAYKICGWKIWIGTIWEAKQITKRSLQKYGANLCTKRPVMDRFEKTMHRII
jgi:hypothetical protein